MLQIWSAGASTPGRVTSLARRLEDEGWDGMALVDSQNLAPDPYVLLGLAGSVTSRLGLATGVTNPLTRHPAAAAAVAATVQAASGGRAVIGIGRGDSALAHLGLAPASPGAFERYLIRLQGYLSGEDVPFDPAGDGGAAAAPSERLGLAGGPSASRLHWVRAVGPKVPVDVAASGSKVIGIAARCADRVTFAVGADPQRLRWAIDEYARAGRERYPDGPSDLGAYVPVVVNPDRDLARRLISGGVASFARFSVMHGHVQGPADETSREALERVHDTYDMTSHFSDGSPQSRDLPDDVIDQFGVAGPAAYCVERLLEIKELGVARLVLLGGGIGMDREAHALSRRLLVDQVLPALR